MGEELSGTLDDVKQEPDAAPQPDPAKELEEAKARAAAAEAKVAEVMKVITSPEYAEFLASRAKPKQAAPAPQQMDVAKLEERLNNMSRIEFAAFLRDAIKQETLEEVKNVYFTPLAQAVTTERTRQEVEAAAREFPDYFDYREEMIKLAEANPSLNARQVYFLAKAQRSAAGVKPPVRKPGGELPAGRPPTAAKEKTNLTAQEAIEKAFEIVGL